MAAIYWSIELFSHRIIRVIARSTARGSAEEREDRAKTLVGVFHNAASLAIVGVGGMMFFQEVGVPVAPLLGGAAVFGLAVAFGAQNLIRDYFYGFVILMENQYKLNDIIKLGGVSGQVERITLRMTVLRDDGGSVHFIPNGQITTVTNMTHGWSRAVIELAVDYKQDVDRVMDLLVEIGKELRQDAAFAGAILEDPTMLGVDALGESAVTIKFYIKTRTLKQWAVRREMLRRIKRRFDDLGIEMPSSQKTTINLRADEPAQATPPPPRIQPAPAPRVDIKGAIPNGKR
ncbi:MAG: mechanosensitive ion channel family protein [Isosphaeraceae bacterium]